MSTSLQSFLTRGLSVVAAVALVSAAACDSSDKAGRQPFANAGAAASANATAGSGAAGQSGPKLPLAALNALDAGNAAYRAKNYSEAMAKYREATLAAPEHAAPWFGLYMVANEVKNTALADSAMKRVKALSADPTAFDAHAEVTAGAPQQGLLPPPSSGNLSSNHPTTQPLPADHPKYKLASPAKMDSVKRTRM